MNGSENQNLTDEQILKIIEEGANSDDSVPADVKSAKPEDQDKISNAFAEQKRKMKALALELQKIKAKELEEKTKAEQAQANAAPRAGGNQVTTLMGQLTMQAMQNLGLDVSAAQTAEGRELIRMERDRLYQDQVRNIQQANAVRERAPKMIEDALSGFSMLGAEGVEAVKRRLQKYDVLAQVDPEVIRQTVTSYLGELTLAGVDVGGNDGTNNSAESTQPRRDKASIAAASTVKNGRMGVKPASRGEETVKPASAEEMQVMRKLGITDVKMFREAQLRKHAYAGK